MFLPGTFASLFNAVSIFFFSPAVLLSLESPLALFHSQLALVVTDCRTLGWQGDTRSAEMWQRCPGRLPWTLQHPNLMNEHFPNHFFVLRFVFFLQAR